MALDADEVFIAGTGHIYVAPVGSTQPTDTTSSWDAAWEELGYSTDAGVTVTPAKTIQDISAWQSRYPVRRIVTAETLEASFALLQWNADTLAFYFGGGDWVGDMYTPPAAGEIDERALGVEVVDGDKIARLVISRGMASPNGGINMIKTDANPIPITFALLGTEGETPFTIIADWVSAS